MPKLTALMAGPWKGARWWRAEGAGAPLEEVVESVEEVATWRRMVHWGEVPDEVHAMLAFAGVSDAGRRRITGRVAAAQRAAAAQAVWHGRAVHAKAAAAEAAAARGTEGEQDRRGSESEGGERGREAGSEEEGRGQMEGGIAGEDGTRRRQNQAEAERAAARAFGKQSRRAAEERKRAAGVAAAAALAQSAANGHLEWEGVTGSKEQQEKVLAAMAVSHAVATGTAGSTKTWSSLAGWWTALSAQRFPGLVCEATGGTCEAVSAGGGACTQPGFRRDGVVACRGCRHAMNGTRAHKGDCRQETRYERRCRSMHCQICGAAGQEGAEETWGGMGRWLMVCGECAGGMKVVPEERRCGVCGTTEAPMIAGKRAVWKGEPDGQWRCGGGGPCGFQERKPGRLWAARAMAMAEIAVPWLGLGGWTADYVRRAAIDVASMACERHQGGFVGNLIPWALWREAAARQWERMEQHTRAGVVRAVTWPECRSIRVGITDRGSTAEENAEGVAPRRRPHEPRPEELAASGGGSAGGRGGGGGGGGGGAEVARGKAARRAAQGGRQETTAAAREGEAGGACSRG